MTTQVILSLEELEDAVRDWLAKKHYQNYESVELDVSCNSEHSVIIPVGGFRFDAVPL